MHSNYLRLLLNDYAPAEGENLWICLEKYLAKDHDFISKFASQTQIDRQFLCRTIGVNDVRIVRKYGFIGEYPDMLAQQIQISLQQITPQIKNKYYQIFEILRSTKLLTDSQKQALKHK